MTYGIWIGLGVLFVWYISWVIRQNKAAEDRITAWEKYTGHRWIREGSVKKGGINPPPLVPFDRPPPPKAWTARR
jgi:hypothetical protein